MPKNGKFNWTSAGIFTALIVALGVSINTQLDARPGGRIERNIITRIEEQAIQGPRGPQGLRGPSGRDGENGERGPRGRRGPEGDHGHRGRRGPRGRKGERGSRGPQGERGASIVGPRGPQGLPGPEPTIPPGVQKQMCERLGICVQ